MPTDPSPYSTHAIDTHPMQLHDGAVVGDEEIDRLKADHRETKRFLNRELDQRDDEIASLRAELAKRDDLIAHYKIGEAGWIEESKKHESAVAKLSEANSRQCDTIMEQTRAIASLRADLAKRDETIAELHADRDTLSKDYITAGYERDKTIASLRSQLARGGAIEAKAKAIYETGDELLGQIEGGFSLYREGRECEELAAFRAALVAFGQRHPASPGPSVTPDGERPSSAEGIAALRAAGGSDWDKIADVRAFLGRDEDENLSRLLESVLAAIEEYNSNFAHMTYKDDAMKAMVKAYADYVAPEAHL